jgi:peptidoglycan hydrolase-like protein with peptidoglycan-binding domain
VRKWIVPGAIGGIVAVGAGAALGFGGHGTEAPAPAKLPPATTKVVKTTLVETEQVSGTLGYGAPKALPATASGTLTWTAAAGSVVPQGKPAYQVDGQPVVVLYGTIPAYRSMKAGDSGADVHQLEQDLRQLGYTGFTVDSYYGTATADAVSQWQKDNGMPQTGQVAAGQIVVVAGEIRIASGSAEIGDKVGPGKPVLSYTSTSRTVTVALDVAKQQLVKKGVPAKVSLPDGSTVDGVVAAVGTVATKTDKSTTIDVTISVQNQKSLGSLDAAPVNVTLVSGKHPDVLAVPVAALVALPDGKYAVQVVTGDAVSYVPVKVGVFAQGKVEVSGVAEGAVVGVPA